MGAWGGDWMAHSTIAQSRATKRYKAKNIKKVTLDMKLEDYAAWKAAADARMVPLNTFIRECVWGQLAWEKMSEET